jgi:hypothetical protein
MVFIIKIVAITRKPVKRNPLDGDLPMRQLLNQKVRSAIDDGHFMFWVGQNDSWRLDLRAVTAINENDGVRTRKLQGVWDDDDAQMLTLRIQEAGGRIDADGLQTILRQRQEQRRRWERNEVMT